MKRIKEIFIDERLRWPDDLCMYCGVSLEKSGRSKEHVPSKCLLLEPYPKELMTLNSCRICNQDLASDEQYFCALLSAVLTGSTKPDMQNKKRAARTLRHQPRLREMIEKSKTEFKTLFGEIRTSFSPDINRIERVVKKNAMGHILYELHQVMSTDPDHIFAVPLQNLTSEQREGFESAGEGETSGWSEIGSRMFVRQCEATGGIESDFRGPWIVVQEGVYRYLIEEDCDDIYVKSVIHEYLATETHWRLDD